MPLQKRQQKARKLALPSEDIVKKVPSANQEVHYCKTLTLPEN